jgi:hypothetical protein
VYVPATDRLPVTLKLLNDGDAVDCKSCGVAIVMVEPEADAVTPYVPENVSVPPPETEPVPEVPDKLIEVEMELLDADVIRPKASTAITGMFVELP